MKRKRPYHIRRLAETHPCVFRERFVREEIDPRVKKSWELAYGTSAPFGRLRLLWREYHCAELNPYDSRDCPYRGRDCALSFLVAVERTCGGPAPPESAPGYFRKLAWAMAQRRADEKGPGVGSAGEAGEKEGRRVPGPDSGPVPIGDLLRSLDIRPREKPTEDGS